MALTKQAYEQALSQAAGQPVVLTDDDYQRLVKGQMLSEKAMMAAKTRGANAGDDFADEDSGPPLLRPDQPAGMYRPVVKGAVAPQSSSIGRISMGEEPRYMGDGPALDVDSAGIGGDKVPMYAKKPIGIDYGSASVPYEVGELGGLGMMEPDRIYAKAPKPAPATGGMVFEPDVVAAKPPAPSSKIDFLARTAFGPAPASKPKKKG